MSPKGMQSPASIELPLPDGSRLRAVADNDEQYPAINIYWEQEDGVSIPICFAEYNPDHPSHELHIGAYQSESTTSNTTPPMRKRRGNDMKRMIILGISQIESRYA